MASSGTAAGWQRYVAWCVVKLFWGAVRLELIPHRLVRRLPQVVSCLDAASAVGRTTVALSAKTSRSTCFDGIRFVICDAA